MRDQKIIKFQNKKFYFHPIYKKYAASKDGQVYSNNHKIIIKQNVKKGGGGYLYLMLIMKQEEKLIQFLDLFTNVLTAL